MHFFEKKISDAPFTEEFKAACAAQNITRVDELTAMSISKIYGTPWLTPGMIEELFAVLKHLKQQEHDKGEEPPQDALW